VAFYFGTARRAFWFWEPLEKYLV